jgi:uncharacterized alkaline shock family protein YloU
MKIRISPDVIRRIALAAAMEVDGVSRAVSRFPLSSDPKKSVHLRTENEKVHLELHLAFYYGVDLLQASRRVQEEVKRAVENLIGAEVATVDVVVEDVDFSQHEATKG